MGEVKQGDIAFSGKRKFSIFANGIKFFTGSKWSHCFILMGDVMGELSVLEADLNCKVVPFKKEYIDGTKDYFEVWRPIKASQEDIERASKICFQECAGAIYGFAQIPWFMWRSLLQKLGFNSNKNWNIDGVICSELLFNYLYELGGEYRELIEGFTPDTTSPEDLYKLVLSRVDLFRFVYKEE